MLDSKAIIGEKTHLGLAPTTQFMYWQSILSKHTLKVTMKGRAKKVNPLTAKEWNQVLKMVKIK